MSSTKSWIKNPTLKQISLVRAPFPTWEPCKTNQKSTLSHTKNPSYFVWACFWLHLHH